MLSGADETEIPSHTTRRRDGMYHCGDALMERGITDSNELPKCYQKPVVCALRASGRQVGRCYGHIVMSPPPPE
jgi:hypothetical protein